MSTSGQAHPGHQHRGNLAEAPPNEALPAWGLVEDWLLDALQHETRVEAGLEEQAEGSVEVVLDRMCSETLMEYSVASPPSLLTPSVTIVVPSELKQRCITEKTNRPLSLGAGSTTTTAARS